MDDPHAWVVRSAVAAAVPAITAWILRWVRSPRPERGSTRRLEYGRRAKAFSIAAFFILPVCVVVVGEIAGPRTAGAMAGWLGGSIAAAGMTAFLVVRTHTATTFDGEGLCILSPLRKARALWWRDVRVIRWDTTGRLVLSDGGRTVVDIHPGLAGARALASEILSRVPPEIVERDLEAQAALDLMGAGFAHTLVMPRARPSVIRAAIGLG
jgi:hypothetical protein